MGKLELLLHTLLHGDSLILEGGGLQLPKIGGGKRKLGDEQP